MKTLKKIQVESEVIDTIICNKCGKEYNIDYFHGLAEVRVSGNYFSKVLADGITYTFSVCEYCLDEYFNQFKHEPETEEYLIAPWLGA